MVSTKSIILSFTFLNFLVQIQCTPESPVVDSYGFKVTEKAVQNTIKNLFSVLKFYDLQHKLKTEQYFKIHDYFASVTVQADDNLKEVARLTKVDNIDNSTRVFITQLNEVFNEDNKSDEATDNAYITILIEDYLYKLINSNETHGLKNNTKFYDINEAIIKYFNKNENEFENKTYFERMLAKGNKTYHNVSNSDEFWQPSGRRIFEGHAVSISRFPFMASVHFFQKFQCGGTIIKSDLVLTAASCLQLAWNTRFFRENPSFLSVRVGSPFYFNGGENIPVIEIYFYPNYNPKNLRHNLAILRLRRALAFKRSIPQIKKINYDRSPVPVSSNVENIIVVGWGPTHRNVHTESLSTIQMTYDSLDFYPLEECQEVYSKEFVTEKNFCAGFFSKGGGACNRDIGGPGILDGIQIGVMSFGSPLCGAIDAPTVFTKLGYYTEWIEQIMEMPTMTAYQLTTPIPEKTDLIFDIFTESTGPTRISPVIRDELIGRTVKPQLRDSFKDLVITMVSSEESTDIDSEQGALTIEKFNLKQKSNILPEMTSEQTVGSTGNTKKNPKVIQLLKEKTFKISPNAVTLNDGPNEIYTYNSIKMTTQMYESPPEEKGADTDDEEADMDDLIKNLVDDIDLNELLHDDKTQLNDSSPKDQNPKQINSDEQKAEKSLPKNTEFINTLPFDKQTPKKSSHKNKEPVKSDDSETSDKKQPKKIYKKYTKPLSDSFEFDEQKPKQRPNKGGKSLKSKKTKNKVLRGVELFETDAQNEDPKLDEHIPSLTDVAVQNEEKVGNNGKIDYSYDVYETNDNGLDEKPKNKIDNEDIVYNGEKIEEGYDDNAATVSQMKIEKISNDSIVRDDKKIGRTLNDDSYTQNKDEIDKESNLNNGNEDNEYVFYKENDKNYYDADYEPGYESEPKSSEDLNFNEYLSIPYEPSKKEKSDINNENKMNEGDVQGTTTPNNLEQGQENNDHANAYDDDDNGDYDGYVDDEDDGDGNHDDNENNKVLDMLMKTDDVFDLLKKSPTE